MKSYKDLLKGSKDIENIVGLLKYHKDFKKEHPNYFYPEGLMIFCGAQGDGKTLSAVQYVLKLCKEYPFAKLVTNVDIQGLPEWTEVIEYNGMESLTLISNGEYGVIYLIDEIHLEFNSLESKNIDIEIMVEVSQQRKQRKHIVGTTQVYGRLAKPFREQLKDCVLCKNYFKFLQVNTLINSQNSHEENGKLITDKCKRYIWFHSPTLYKSYDTFAKMKRYRNEWQGRTKNKERGYFNG